MLISVWCPILVWVFVIQSVTAVKCADGSSSRWNRTPAERHEASGWSDPSLCLLFMNIYINNKKKICNISHPDGEKVPGIRSEQCRRIKLWMFRSVTGHSWPTASVKEVYIYYIYQYQTADRRLNVPNELVATTVVCQLTETCESRNAASVFCLVLNMLFWSRLMF